MAPRVTYISEIMVREAARATRQPAVMMAMNYLGDPHGRTPPARALALGASGDGLMGPSLRWPARVWIAGPE